MSHHLLLIEPVSAYAGESVAALLATDATLSFDRADWETLFPERLRQRATEMVVAFAAGHPAKPLTFFQWLHAHPLAVPTFAVLPQSADEELLRTALEAVDDFTLWPTRPEALHHRIARLLGPERGTVESVHARLAEQIGVAQLVGTDPAFTRLVEQLPSIADSDAPVLITGETGTGKELCARAIHFLGKRRNLSFIPVDCGALPDHLVEDELFGHARGAYTDAHRDQRGLIAMAEGGTLFLDEVDTLSLPAQAKLLRFLQEHTFRPLGADRFVQADVNVIVATNRDLESWVREGQFRSDLYFRINVLRLHLPPLRERRGDIGMLARHFLAALRKPTDPIRKSFSALALQKLALYDWPGNIRELFNVVQRAVVLSEGSQILPSSLSLPNAAPVISTLGTSFRRARAAFERLYMEELLRKHHGNITHAAAEAQTDRRAFGRLVKKYNIDPKGL
jgi:two-component system response regulator GlrR